MKRCFQTALLVLLLQWARPACAQQPVQEQQPAPVSEQRFEAGFDGMLAISAGSKTLGINVGGPSLKFRFSPAFKVGVGAFPSLFIRDRLAVPRLAVSPIVEYRRWMLITPYYGYDSTGRQVWTFGLGYKFI